MAVVLADELEICEDCAFLVANSEGTPEHAAAMVAVWGADTNGLVLACKDDDEESCPSFSSRRCDGCNSDMAGSRHAAAVIANSPRYCPCPPNVQCPAVRAPYDETAPAYCEHCGLDMDTSTDAEHPFTAEHVDACDECARTLTDEQLVTLGLLL